jgi:anaerobic magnesium-protoporphyrin IX monomethyl ester cyclase
MKILLVQPGQKLALQGNNPAVSLFQEDVWRQFALHPTPDFEPPIWGEHFTKQELQKLIAESYKKFYLRPEYIWQRLIHLRSFAELKRKLKAGLSVLRM